MQQRKNSMKENKNKCTGNNCEGDYPAWVPAYPYKYCGKNPKIKDPKERDERAAMRKVKQKKRYGSGGSSSNKASELSKLKATNQRRRNIWQSMKQITRPWKWKQQPT